MSGWLAFLLCNVQWLPTELGKQYLHGCIPFFFVLTPTTSFLLACYPLLTLAEDLILQPAKIISAWEPLQLLSLSTWRTFPISPPSGVYLITQISVLAVPRTDLPFSYMYAPHLSLSTHQSIPCKAYSMEVI